ncbi:MAG: hypothetical protein M0R06_03045 [Sphaerochaeta sp.]|jgi:hypothetical protein|nr:hypothetical protein [Sphaerochaeta sp.]
MIKPPINFPKGGAWNEETGEGLVLENGKWVPWKPQASAPAAPMANASSPTPRPSGGVLPGSFLGDLARGVGAAVKQSFAPKTNPILERAVGLGEAGINAASGLAGGMAGLVGGVGKEAIDTVLRGPSSTPFQNIEDTTGKISDVVTYKPKTQSGADFSSVANAPFNAIGAGVDAAARGLSRNDEGQAAVRLVGNTALNLALGKLGAKVAKKMGASTDAPLPNPLRPNEVKFAEATKLPDEPRASVVDRFKPLTPKKTEGRPLSNRPPDLPEELRTPLKQDSSSKAPVYLDEVQPFIEGKYQDRFTKGFIASTQNPHHAWGSYPEIYKMTVEPYNEAVHRTYLTKQKIAEEVRRWSKEYTRDERDNVGKYATAVQEGGKEHLGGATAPTSLSPRETALYEKLRSSYDQFLDEANKARSVNGQDPIPKVENYQPFMADIEALEKAGVDLLRDPLSAIQSAMLQHRRHKAKITFKHEISREPGAKTPVITDPLVVFQRYANRAAELINMTPVLAKTRSLLSTIDVPAQEGTVNQFGRPVTTRKWSLSQGFIDDPKSYGYPRLAEEIQGWSDFVSGKQMGTNNQAMRWLERASRKLSKNVATSTLGGNVRSAAIQPTALLGTINLIGYYNTLRGIAKMALSPSAVREAMSRSRILAGRSMDIDIYNPGNAGAAKTIGQALRWVGDKSMFPLKYLDMKTAQASWIGAFDMYKQLGMGLKEAALAADEMTLKTQGSGLPGHVAPIQRSPGGRFATIFQTFGINQWNHILGDIFGIKDPSIKTKADWGRVNRVIHLLTATQLFNAAYEALGVRSPFPSPDTEMRLSKERGDTTAKTLYTGAKEFAQWLPFANFLRWSSGGLQALPAGLDVLVGRKGLIGIPEKIISGKANAGDLESIARVSGIPFATQAFKTANRLGRGQSLPKAIVGARVDIPGNQGAGNKKKKKKPGQGGNYDWLLENRQP